MDNIKKIEDELASYLKDQCRYFGCEVTYHGNDKKRFTLEVPAHAAGKAGRDYSLEGQKKGAKRFTTTTTKVSFLKGNLLCGSKLCLSF